MKRYKSLFQEAGAEEYSQTKVLTNPAIGELKKLSSQLIDKGEVGSIRGVLNQENAYFWTNENLLHKYFLDNHPLKGIKITIEILPLENPVEVSASVTNKTVNDFFKLPEDKQTEAIAEHPWIQKNCPKCKINT